MGPWLNELSLMLSCFHIIFVQSVPPNKVYEMSLHILYSAETAALLLTASDARLARRRSAKREHPWRIKSKEDCAVKAKSRREICYIVSSCELLSL